MTTYPVIFLNGVTAIDAASGNIKFQGGDAVLELPASLMRTAHSPDAYHQELQYLALLQELVNKADGTPREDRTGTGTFSVFGRQMRFNLSTGEFPLLTTKSVHFKSMLAELAWMLRGETNINTLDARIWNEWADENGDLGPIYGAQWRSWKTAKWREEKGETEFAGMDYTIHHPVEIDQIAKAIDQIKTNPGSRRILVSAWNVGELEDMKLAPCHIMFQFYVEDGYLDLQLYQRSADIFLGVPFNIASYALLLQLIAAECGLKPREFVHTFGDLHLYSNHVEQAREQLSRHPKPLPQVLVRPQTNLFDLKPEDVKLIGYDPHPTIKAEVSV